MAQFIRPPISDVPYGGSFGGVFEQIGQSISEYMQRRDVEEERKKREKAEAIAQSIEGENRLLDLAPVLSEFEPATPTPMFEPAAPELGIPERKVGEVQLGETRQAKPLLTEITLPSGQKVPVPPVRGMRERLAAEEEAKRLEGTEVLTEDVWKELPPFFKGRWKPGQRVNTKDVGTVGLAVFEAASRAAAERGRSEAKTPNYKSQFDRVQNKDVMVSDEMIAMDLNRYAPPREARLVASEERATRAAEAKEAKAAAAEEKKTAHAQAVEDAAERIAAGEPAANVGGTVRDAAVKLARERGARVFTTQPQKDKVLVLESIKRDVDRLNELLSDPKVAGYFGPGAGTITGWAEGLPAPVVKVPDEVMEARSLMLNLQDRTLRQRSGAQINQVEMKRITQFSPDPTHRFNKTMINLKRMGAELDGLISGQFKGSVGGATPAAAGKPLSSSMDALLQEYGGK